MASYTDLTYYSEQDYLRLDMAEAVERMGDKDIYLEISRYFAEHIPDSVADLGKALMQGDLASATRLAHSMKSNCAAVGAELLREGSFELERLCREGDLCTARELFSFLHNPFLSLGNRLLELK
jgi:HPt (histidine-containing phosphotransfer) domain-containing protein